MFSQEQQGHKAGLSFPTKTLDIKTSYTTKNTGILGCHSENKETRNILKNYQTQIKVVVRENIFYWENIAILFSLRNNIL